jgi:hypothetical protein
VLSLLQPPSDIAAHIGNQSDVSTLLCQSEEDDLPVQGKQG